MVTIARVISVWIIFMLLLFLSGSFLTKIFPGSWERWVYGISGTMAALLATRLILENEHRDFKSIGLKWQKTSLPNFFTGFIIGAVILSVLLGILYAFTPLDITKSTAQFSLPGSMIYLSIIPLALMEEIAFRGYAFTRLNENFGLLSTQILIGLAFAAYHIITGWNWQIALLGPGIWSFVFGLAAFKSGGIAMPTGIHVALNMGQVLSGLKPDPHASAWIIKSPESIQQTGLYLQVMILLAALFIQWWYQRQYKAA